MRQTHYVIVTKDPDSICNRSQVPDSGCGRTGPFEMSLLSGSLVLRPGCTEPNHVSARTGSREGPCLGEHPKTGSARDGCAAETDSAFIRFEPRVLVKKPYVKVVSPGRTLRMPAELIQLAVLTYSDGPKIFPELPSRTSSPTAATSSRAPSARLEPGRWILKRGAESLRGAMTDRTGNIWEARMQS